MDDPNDFSAMASLAAPTPVAPTVEPSPAPAGDVPKNEAPRDHIAALLSAGASQGDIERYAKGQGIDPSRIKGLGEAVTFRDQHPDAAPSSVRLYSDPIAIAPKPDTLSGLTPQAVEDRFSHLPALMKPGLGDAVSNGIFQGLDTEAGALTQAAGTAIAHPIDTYISGGQNVADSYHDARTTGLARVDYANQHNPNAAPLADFVGAMINPIGAEAKGITGAMKVAGGMGLVSGFENNNGSLADRAENAGINGAISAVAAPVIGGVVGGLATGANKLSGGRLANFLESRAANGTNETIFNRTGQTPVPTPVEPTQGQNVIDASDRLSRGDVKVEPSAPMVGGTISQKLAAGSDQTLLGGLQISRGLNRLNTGLDAANSNAAREAGGVAGRSLDETASRISDPSVEGSLGSYEARSGAQADALYEDAYARGGEHVELNTPAMIARLDSEISRMEKNPTPPAGLQNLSQLRQTLDSGTWTPRGLRDLRTGFGDQLEAGDRTTREAANRLWGPLSDDIQNGFRNIGKDDAANAFAKADKFYNDRAKNLDDIVPHILGNLKSGERVADSLVNLSRSDGQRLNRALGLMEPAQAGEVRGALITNLGLAKDANQNAAGNQFSPAEWATNWSKMSDDGKKMFNGRVSSDLNDLATVIQGVKTSGRMRNNSNTAGALNVLNILHKIGNFGGGGALVGAVGGGVPLALSSVGSAILGHVMSSPGVARALVGRARGQTPAWFANRLNGIAARSSVEVAKALRGMISADDSTQANPVAAKHDPNDFSDMASEFNPGATVADTTPDAPDPVDNSNPRPFVDPNAEPVEPQ
jgi:hypothetical protein